MAFDSLPALSPDHVTSCGWLYGAFVMDGEVVDLPSLTVVHFTPIGPGATLMGDIDPDDPELFSCDSCGLTSAQGQLWSWSDIWAGGVDLSGVECRDCILDDGGEPTQGWVPSPLALA